jgi:hypothetical protein
MNEVAPSLLIGGGYSNYLEIDNDVLNEVFFGASSSSITGVAFIGLGSELSPNYLGTLNLNSFFPFLSIDSSVMCILSKEINEFGYDIFFNMSKTVGSGLSYGYSLSSERYEDEERRTFNKQGHSKTFTVPVTDQGLFISFFIGWTF